MKAALLVLILATSSALAADLPRRKSGLWEISVSGAGIGNMRLRECVDQQTDNLAKAPTPGEDDMSCSKVDVRRQGAGYVMDAVCKVDDSTVTSHTVFSGSFESAYRADTKVQYRPPLEGISEAAMRIEARWTGPCKPGQKPGDVELAGPPERPKPR